MFHWRRLMIVFLILVSAQLVVAQPGNAPVAQEERPPELVTRVYDITDMLWQKSDYPVESEPSQVDMFNGPASRPSRDQVVEDFVGLIQDTIDSDTWKENGGSFGSIRELSGQVIITQTADAHKRIASLIQQLRENKGRMVVVRAYWLLLDPASVPPVTQHTNGKQLPAWDAADDKLFDAKHLYCAAQTTCYSGQTVHVTSGRKRTVVSGLTPIVGSQAMGYQPRTEKARSGVTLQVTPHLEPESPDARIAIDVQSTVTELESPPSKADVPPSTQPCDPVAAIDRVTETEQELRTTVRLPLGLKVLIGGMTLQPAGGQDARQLYLVIQADAVK